MMGQLAPQQNNLFYEFCLESHIPEDHLLRQIDQFLDFDQIHDHLKSYYSHTGRPSIDPELMIRILLIGYCYGIRSERRLCEEVRFNLAYRWFCHLGLEDEIPDHSTFSKNRHGHFRDADLLRLVFDSVVQRCNEHGLIKGEGFATDASYIKADASAAMLNWVVEKKHIEPHIPVWDKSNSNPEVFGRSDFTWDKEANCYHCPAGRSLLSRQRNFKKYQSPVTKANTIIYRSSQVDCRACKLKSQCCPNTAFRKIARSIFEESRDVARRVGKTQAYQQSLKDRKKVEVLFAHLKRIMNFDRLRLRGITGARDEFLMPAAVQNLKKLAQQRYKPPDHRIGAPA